MAIVAAQCFFDTPEGIDAFFATFESTIAPMLTDKGNSFIGSLRTEHAANDFPALPVREDENAVVLFTRHSEYAARQRYINALAGAHDQPPDILNLSPTSRSPLQ